MNVLKNPFITKDLFHLAFSLFWPCSKALLALAKLTRQNITVTVLSCILLQLSNFPTVRLSFICFQRLQQSDKLES